MIGITVALKKAKMDQKDLAKAMHRSETTISNWVTGRSRPSIEQAKQIAKITGCEVNEIIKDY